MQLAKIPPGKDEIQNFIDYLKNQIKKSGVKVELKKRVSSKILEEIEPDAVIIATGAKPFIPKIPNIGNKNVVMALEALKGDVEVKGKICIVGGGQVGAETAEFLAKQKRGEVTLIEMTSEIATGMPNTSRQLLLFSLKDNGVSILTKKIVEKVTESGVVVSNEMGKEELIEADMIIFATGSKPDKELAQAVKDKVSEVYLIGDCLEPRKMIDAISEGMEIASSI